MTNVLIPTDFSEYSRNAIRYALEYFGEAEVNFFLLHVLPPTLEEDEFIEGDAAMTTTAVAEKKLITPDLYIHKNHKFFPIEERGSVVEVIRRHVDNKNIEFIVMGTAGISDELKSPGVSNTYEVITKIKCPILVVPEYAQFHQNLNVSFVTDYNCIYRNKVLATLSGALLLHDSPLRILKPRRKTRPLTPAQVDNRGFIHYFFRDREHSFHFLKNENMEQGIQEFVDEFEIGMIAIAARNLNFIQKLMLRFSADGVTYHRNVPFLVLHE